MKSGVVQPVAVAVTALLVAGCQSVQGAWYYQTKPEGPASRTGTLSLALLNDSRRDHRVSMLVINHETRFRQEFPISGNFHRGQLLVVDITAKRNSCILPVDALLIVEGGRKLAVRLSSDMPTALPSDWQGCAMADGLP